MDGHLHRQLKKQYNLDKHSLWGYNTYELSIKDTQILRRPAQKACKQNMLLRLMTGCLLSEFGGYIFDQELCYTKQSENGPIRLKVFVLIISCMKL